MGFCIPNMWQMLKHFPEVISLSIKILFLKGAMLQMNFVFLNQDKVDTLVLLFTAVYKCQNQCKW